MTTLVAEPTFLDTNILIYLTHNTADFDRFASYITVAPLERNSA